MEPSQPGNNQLPDFNQLNDRIIREQPSGPMLVIKTNLDSKDILENNPYYHSQETKNPKAFRNFFEE
jgi:hypothetical protein